MFRDDHEAARARRDAARAELRRLRTPEALEKQARLEALTEENLVLRVVLEREERWTVVGINASPLRLAAFVGVMLLVALTVGIAWSLLRW